ncbi:MAG TPA: septum formation inhibitor Maf [Chromatiales bacterium]|nr:septum formation inhibitor Maf [Chromatiales bacterium]
MNVPICLASASPRRHELLAQLGIDCELCAAEVDESVLPGETAADYVRRLSFDKARAVVRQPGCRSAALVLAADTAVVVDGEILGKPRGEQDAVATLLRLGGRSHEVLTGVAVTDGTRELAALSRSVVRFRQISVSEAHAYWRTGEPADKAGAYAIQGLGTIFVQQLQGSYSGVMGLPLFETAQLLQTFGYDLLEVDG